MGAGLCPGGARWEIGILRKTDSARPEPARGAARTYTCCCKAPAPACTGTRWLAPGWVSLQSATGNTRNKPTLAVWSNRYLRDAKRVGRGAAAEAVATPEFLLCKLESLHLTAQAFGFSDRGNRDRIPAESFSRPTSRGAQPSTRLPGWWLMLYISPAADTSTTLSPARQEEPAYLPEVPPPTDATICKCSPSPVSNQPADQPQQPPTTPCCGSVAPAGAWPVSGLASWIFPPRRCLHPVFTIDLGEKAVGGFAYWSGVPGGGRLER